MGWHTTDTGDCIQYTMPGVASLSSLSHLRIVARDVTRQCAQTITAHPRTVAATAVGIGGAIGLAMYLHRRGRLSPEEHERLRRNFLCSEGRLSDGAIVDTTEAGVSSMLVYQYRIAGVDYECSQDLSALPDQMVNIRVDLPVQVRYDPRNPGNSIVAAENWTGLQHGAVYTGVLSQQAEEV